MKTCYLGLRAPEFLTLHFPVMGLYVSSQEAPLMMASLDGLVQCTQPVARVPSHDVALGPGRECLATPTSMPLSTSKSLGWSIIVSCTTHSRLSLLLFSPRTMSTHQQGCS